MSTVAVAHTFQAQAITLDYTVTKRQKKHVVAIDLSNASRSLRKRLLKEVQSARHVREARFSGEALVCRLQPSSARLTFDQIVSKLLGMVARKIERHDNANTAASKDRKSGKNRPYVNRRARVPASALA